MRCEGAHRRRIALAFALVASSLVGAGSAAAAAPIDVPCTGTGGGAAGLAAAIVTADTSGGGTISLAAGCTYTFSSPFANAGGQDLAGWYGPAALPAIASSITVVGNGATIARSTAGGTPPFRLFFVGADPTAPATLHWTTPGAGSLTLEDLTLTGGLAQGGASGAGGGGLGAGGAIFNQGTVIISAVTLSGNRALGGAAGTSGLGSGGAGVSAAAAGSATNSGGGFGGGFTPPAGAPSGGMGGDGLTTTGGGGGAGFATGENGAAGGTILLGGPGAGGGPLTGLAGDGQTNNGAKGGDGGGGGSGTTILNAGGTGGGYGAGGIGGASGGAGGGGVGGGGGGAANGAGGGFGGGGGSPGGQGGFGAGGAGGGGGTGGGGGFGGGGGGPSVGGGGAGLGGAIFNQQGVLAAVNATLSANTAAGGSGAAAGQGLGGALFSLNGLVGLVNDTVAANTADDGGALYIVGYDANSATTSAVASLENNILSGSQTAANASTHDLGVARPGAVADGAANKATASATVPMSNVVVSQTATGSISGTPLTANPLLGSLANNGGPGMLTMLPGAGSPALRAGTTRGAPSTDERGTARPATGPIDLGAVQVSVAGVTGPGPPTPLVIDLAATSVGATTAMLNATVNPEGLATSYHFEYGTTTRYGSTTKTTNIGAGATPVAVSTRLSKLRPGTTYHWRLVATSANGTSDGVGRRFTTRAVVRSVAGLPVTAVPRHARRFPYIFTFGGTLRLPRGMTHKVGCKGTVSVRIKHGSTTVLVKRAPVTSRCTWHVSARLATRASVPGAGTLAVIVRFGGNGALAPHADKALAVSYG